MCLSASVLHQQEDASSIPTTPSQINNPPPLDTSESPCLQMLCLHCIYPQGLLLPPSPSLTTLKALRRATLPACNQHIHTQRPTNARDGWSFPLVNAQRHYPSPTSPEERDALLKLTLCSTAASLAMWKSARRQSYSCRKVPPPNLSWVGGW